MSTTARGLIPTAKQPETKWKPRRHLRRPQLPDVLDVPIESVADAMRDLIALVDKERSSVAEVRALEARRREVADEDRAEIARWARGGGSKAKRPELGTHAAALEQEIVETASLVDGISQAADDAQRDLARLLEREAAGLHAAFADRWIVARERFNATIDELETAKSEVDRARALLSWSHDWSLSRGLNSDTNQITTMRPFVQPDYGDPEIGQWSTTVGHARRFDPGLPGETPFQRAARELRERGGMQEPYNAQAEAASARAIAGAIEDARA